MSGGVDAETTRIVKGFEEATLPRLPHADHVRIAWAYARELPLLDAIGRIREGLRRYAAARGVPEKYHETVTWAFMVLIHQRARGTPEASWDAFARANDDLFDQRVLLRWYHPETLASTLARETFVLPDGGAVVSRPTMDP
jgi:hypothetical protein